MVIILILVTLVAGAKYRTTWRDVGMPSKNEGLNIFYGFDDETIKITNPKARHPAIEFFPESYHINITSALRSKLPYRKLCFTTPDLDQVKVYNVMYRNSGGAMHWAIQIGSYEIQLQVDDFVFPQKPLKKYRAPTILISEPLVSVKRRLATTNAKKPLTSVDPMARSFTYMWRYAACKISLSNAEII
jgi:hypothetical protein